jgi:inhibitor of cysteine peptidase
MSTHRFREIVISIAAAMATFACVPPGETGGGSPPEIYIDASADHATVPLQVGQRMLITLQGNATTGFRWELLPGFEPVLTQEGNTEYQAERRTPGRGGSFRFLLRGGAPGTASVKLVYRRPFEQGVPPAQRFEVGVVVTK